MQFKYSYVICDISLTVMSYSYWFLSDIHFPIHSRMSLVLVNELTINWLFSGNPNDFTQDWSHEVQWLIPSQRQSVVSWDNICDWTIFLLTTVMIIQHTNLQPVSQIISWDFTFDGICDHIEIFIFCLSYDFKMIWSALSQIKFYSHQVNWIFSR